MKVFISWSGEKSQEVAKVLKQWIPCVIQSVEPYFSSSDIDKGARWSTDIAKELQDASYGVLCVTRDNLDSAWLNFEAGALSKSIDQAKVCPFLIDIKPSDIQDSPILQFQMAKFTKEDVLKLFESINANLDERKLTNEVLSETFDAFWPKIEKDLNEVSDQMPTIPKKGNKGVDQNAIEEILELVRNQHKLLKSPSELLPPEYLHSVLDKSESTFPRMYYEEIEDMANEIFRIASSVAEVSPVIDLEIDENSWQQKRETIMSLSDKIVKLTQKMVAKNLYYPIENNRYFYKRTIRN